MKITKSLSAVLLITIGSLALPHQADAQWFKGRGVSNVSTVDGLRKHVAKLDYLAGEMPKTLLNGGRGNRSGGHGYSKARPGSGNHRVLASSIQNFNYQVDLLRSATRSSSPRAIKSAISNTELALKSLKFANAKGRSINIRLAEAVKQAEPVLVTISDSASRLPSPAANQRSSNRFNQTVVTSRPTRVETPSSQVTVISTSLPVSSSTPTSSRPDRNSGNGNGSGDRGQGNRR